MRARFRSNTHSRQSHSFCMWSARALLIWWWFVQDLAPRRAPRRRPLCCFDSRRVPFAVGPPRWQLVRFVWSCPPSRRPPVQTISSEVACLALNGAGFTCIFRTAPPCRAATLSTTSIRGAACSLCAGSEPAILPCFAALLPACLRPPPFSPTHSLLFVLCCCHAATLRTAS